MKHPRSLSTTALSVVVLLCGALLFVNESHALERVRGSTGTTRRQHRQQQIRTLKRRGETIKYSRLLVNDWDDSDDEDEVNEEDPNEPRRRRRRRLPPSKVSKACSSKSLKGSKDGTSGKAGSKSKTTTRPSCDTSTAFCSCPQCTQQVLDRMAGDYTCGARMEFLLSTYPNTFAKTRQACARVAGLEFPQECGECDPSTCSGRKPSEPKFYCGCQTCDNSVWDRDAGGYSCGARISWAMIVDQEPQSKACTLVSDQYPQCASCNPETCTAKTTPSPTEKQVPIAPPTPAREAPTAAPVAGNINVTSHCSCTTCTADVWDADTGGNVTCGDRIDWLMANMNLTEAGACTQNASSEFPEICSPCDPSTCATTDVPVTAPTALGPVVAPTPLAPVTAPTAVAPTPAAPVVAPTAAAPVVAPTAVAPVVAPAPLAPVTAPTPLAPVTAPTALAPVTAPTALAPVAAPTAVGPVAAPTPAVAPTTTVQPPTPAVAPSASSGSCPAVTADTSIYCFRNASDRVAYDSVWGSYRVEVKRDPDNAKCAPNANRFSEDTVSLSGDELSLKFKKTSGGWLSSEVRVVLPNSEMYSYGYYEFSVKSVAVKNRTTREVMDYTLPPELVFGMFTYDPRENCQESSDTYYREVDMELSRWGYGSNSSVSGNSTGYGNSSGTDGMFLVQPPDVAIQTYRFYTGTNQDYDQGGHTYGFYWHPNNLTWQTSAGGGQTFTYTSQQAVAAGMPDRVQCLPAPIDVRINLWNLNQQATDASLGLSDDQLVEVIVDRFTYTPSGETGGAAGDFCTKDCQCGSNLSCSGNACVAA